MPKRLNGEFGAATRLVNAKTVWRDAKPERPLQEPGLPGWSTQGAVAPARGSPKMARLFQTSNHARRLAMACQPEEPPPARGQPSPVGVDRSVGNVSAPYQSIAPPPKTVRRKAENAAGRNVWRRAARGTPCQGASGRGGPCAGFLMSPQAPTGAWPSRVVTSWRGVQSCHAEHSFLREEPKCYLRSLLRPPWAVRKTFMPML